MAPRLIVHAGFHKTGTTSIQSALTTARDLLRSHVQVLVRADMVALCEACRAYSISRSATDLAVVSYEAALLAAQWPDDGLILLSSEDLSGHMPGRRGLRLYDAAPNLCHAMATAWQAALPDIGLAFVFTTRAAQPWLASCHMQHLRAIRMRLTQAEYAQDYAASADLDGTIDDIRHKLGDLPVHTLPLEDKPLDHLMQIAGVPQTLWPDMPHRNQATADDLRTALLDINCSDLSDADARAARKDLMRAKG